MLHLDDIIDTLIDYYTEMEDDLNLTLDKEDNNEYFLFDRHGTIITLYMDKNMSLKKLMDCDGDEFELHTSEILKKHPNGFTHEMVNGDEFNDKTYTKLLTNIKSGSKDYGISIRTEFKDSGKLKSSLFEISKEIGADTIISYNSLGKIKIDEDIENTKHEDFFKKLKTSDETLKGLISILNLINSSLKYEWSIDIHSQDHSSSRYQGNRFSDISEFEAVITVDIFYKPTMQSDWESKIPNINKREELIKFIKRLDGKRATELINLLTENIKY